jgi:hypothetical protein
MASHKVYPLAGFHVPGVPHRVHELDSKKDAQVLLDTGAFTDNPNHPGRQPGPDAPASVDEPTTTSDAEAHKTDATVETATAEAVVTESEG